METCTCGLWVLGRYTVFLNTRGVRSGGLELECDTVCGFCLFEGACTLTTLQYFLVACGLLAADTGARYVSGHQLRKGICTGRGSLPHKTAQGTVCDKRKYTMDNETEFNEYRLCTNLREQRRHKI